MKIITFVMLFCFILMSGCASNDIDYSYDEPDFESVIETQEDFEDEESLKASELDKLPEPVDIEVDINVEPNSDNSFFITTNLPDGTELMLALSGKGYLAQDKVYVGEGCATSSVFTNHGAALEGVYELEVMMPIATVQNDFVKHFIGDNGQYLKGPYVSSALGSVIVKKNFTVTLPGEALD